MSLDRVMGGKSSITLEEYNQGLKEEVGITSNSLNDNAVLSRSAMAFGVGTGIVLPLMTLIAFIGPTIIFLTSGVHSSVIAGIIQGSIVGGGVLPAEILGGLTFFIIGYISYKTALPQDKMDRETVIKWLKKEKKALDEDPWRKENPRWQDNQARFQALLSNIAREENEDSDL